jgi:hypothetical protein
MKTNQKLLPNHNSNASKKVIYTPELIEKLHVLRDSSQEFSKENPHKSHEQFLAEGDIIIDLIFGIRNTLDRQ